MAEQNFCEHKGLNIATMRTTWEAKQQLKDLLVAQGFPEGCMLPQVKNEVFMSGKFQFSNTRKLIENCDSTI
jgi:hypothetical protein